MTSYPNSSQASKIAIQWATSAKDMQKSDKAVIYRLKTNPNSLLVLNKTGKIQVTIPKQAERFRVLVWLKKNKSPDLLTNWVLVVPNKTYTLQKDQLIPAVLMSGTGC